MTDQPKPVRKPLRTRDEIFAAYPEHKKIYDLEPQIKALEKFLWAMKKAGAYFCQKNKSTDEYGVDYTEWLPATQFEFPSSAMQEFIWNHLGIDPAKIWAEKNDMIEQIALAFGVEK